jgi:outer membrane protein OmpA-like peptidoglycan-associated protein
MSIKSLLLLIASGLVLFGCASSNVTRDVSSGVDMGVQNAKNLYDGATEGDFVNAYQNTSQATKGALIGGAAGAVTGAMSSSVGFLPGAAAGLILGASYGSYIDANSSLQDKLVNRGVNVIVLGDQILIVIPSARLFNPLTSTINPSAYSTLNLVAQYINSYTKMLVKVSAFTNDLGSQRVNMSLSQQQAKNVAKILLASGVDARLLYAEGYGGTHLVDVNSKVWDGSDNYRIEISLERLQA